MYRSQECHPLWVQHLDPLNGLVRKIFFLKKNPSISLIFFFFFVCIGPDLGSHTDEVLMGLLGLTRSEIEELETSGITKPK